MSVSDPLQNLIQNFSGGALQTFMRSKSRLFKPTGANLSSFDKDKFSGFQQIGEIEFGEKQNWDRLIVVSAKVDGELGERSCRKAQFETARKILKTEQADAGIFAFHDAAGRFRFSLIYTLYEDKKLRFSHFRRFTYFVQPDTANKTFVLQVGGGSFESIQAIKKAFSVEAVSDAFYDAFKPHFGALAASVIGLDRADAGKAEDFALLLVIRTIFLGFIQKRGWLGGDTAFLQSFRAEFVERGKKGTFFSRWLEPLFFEALNTPPGHKVAYRDNEFSSETEKKLQMAPFLNGGLFCRKKGYDDRGWAIPDKALFEFFDFLFQYNFTIEENTLYDEDLELNPEFLGIIFERLINKEDGAVYTPREEVDLMCRLSLVKWLEKNNETGCQARDLYELFFRELGDGDSLEVDQRSGSFSERQAEDLIRKLANITVCDPAVGSGAFPVGMMHVLDEIELRLYEKAHKMFEKSAFERKLRIIQNTLYGVEVKEWAVWICQLRLWISLFIEAEDSQSLSIKPLLPSLDFKIRRGDSLVQMIGSRLFPVQGHADISAGMKARVTQLKNAKADYFQNRTQKDGFSMVRHMETGLFRDILSDEISQKRLSLSGKSGKTQDVLFGEAEQLGLTKTTALQNEIRELEVQRDSLRDDHPLIWNIEFAEIFADRGGFDLVIGNPPYVQQEDIADPYGRLEAKEYKNLLGEMVKKDFPDSFRKTQKINGKSDLYTYFYLRGLRLLNEFGVHAFICSNSWLDVGYGAWLQKFLLENCHIRFIVDNHARRSFANADVNTIISIIDAPKPKARTKTLGKETVRFIAFKRPFEETVYTENLIEINGVSSIVKNERFRVYPVSQSELKEQGTEYDTAVGDGSYTGDKWGGKYLRAPDIFFTVLEKGASFADTFGAHFDGERYLNTGGADGFFILTGVNYNEPLSTISNGACIDVALKTPFEGTIESKYLKPLIKDALKKNKTIRVDGYDAYCLVVPPDVEPSKKVQKYIQWGELQGYNKRSVTKLQTPWYKPTRQMLSSGRVLLPRSFNDVFVVHHNPSGFLSLRFYRLHIKHGKNEEPYVAFMNSTLFWMIFETLGNKSLGQGALDFFMEDFLRTKMPLIISAALENVFKKMKGRKIESIFSECGINARSEIPIEDQEPHPLPDRKELDDIVFNALKLTADERKDVYRAVCRLVWNRISKAQSV